MSRISRTLATYKMEFFVTFAISWKLVKKYGFFGTYFKQDMYFHKTKSLQGLFQKNKYVNYDAVLVLDPWICQSVCLQS